VGGFASRYNINNLPHDAVKLQLRDLRALECVLGEGVANSVLGSALPESLNELVIDALLDVDARTSAAALSVVEVDTKVDPVDGLVEVGIIKDNVGALASELESNLLQVGASGRLHNLSADDGGTSESDLVNVHVGGHGSTGDLSETSDDVDDTWWEAGLLDELASYVRRQRCLLSSLEDNHVTGGNGGADLPCPHEQGEVPRDNLTANTNLLKVSGCGGWWAGY
jgi:hypothetical protein